MSSSIHEDPDLTINIKYSKGEDRRERLERVVDIYKPQDREPHTQKHLPAVQRNWFRLLALILGLLCVVLVAGFMVLYEVYVTSARKEEQLNIKYKNLASELERINCQLGKESETQGKTTEWKRFQCSCYYISTKRKNWTESRKDCKKRGADLVVLKTKTKHDFYKNLSQLGEFWIGLESVDMTNNWMMNWKWVDGSSLTFTSFKAGEKSDPKGDLKAYMDLQGTWSHNSSGSKHWICELDIY